jgi:CheY-like chemotaxis protein
MIAYVANRILIVDDSPHFRAMAAELLAERGFDVLATAEDGEQALAAVDQVCPDGILLDVNLPGRDGFAMAGLLAAACPAARIVLTSADFARLPSGVLTDCAAAAFVAKEDLAAADLGRLFTPPAGT